MRLIVFLSAILGFAMAANAATACIPRVSKFYFTNGSLELRPNLNHDEELDLLRDLGDRAEISRIVLVGHSLGATPEAAAQMAMDRTRVIQRLLEADGVPANLVQTRVATSFAGWPDDPIFRNVVEAYIFTNRDGVEVDGCGTPTGHVPSE